jgi:hypothetical protein
MSNAGAKCKPHHHCLKERRFVSAVYLIRRLQTAAPWIGGSSQTNRRSAAEKKIAPSVIGGRGGIIQRCALALELELRFYPARNAPHQSNFVRISLRQIHRVTGPGDWMVSWKMAEGVGFEPTAGLTLRSISSRVP